MFIEPNPEIIKRNFGKISETYDVANDVMTLGMLRSWRQKLVDWSGAKPGDAVLDVATGTGDLAFLFRRAVGNEGRVVGLDLTPEMLDVADQKALEKKMKVEWVEGDSMALPFKDNSFDVATISYGIRNVKDPKKALEELARVVKPGGKVLVLETGAPSNHIWRKIYGSYFKNILPTIGGLASNGHFGPYRFLQKSSMAFPSGLEFLNWMQQVTKFGSMDFQSFLGGVSYLYRGVVKEETLEKEDVDH